MLKVVIDENVVSSRDIGHNQTARSKTSESNSNHAIPLFNSIADAVDDKFSKNVCVNGTMLNAYIDFGSDCSLIRCSDAVALGLTESTDQRLPTIRGFGNSAVIPKFKTTVQIRVDEIDTELDVLAVEDAFLQVPLLIGQNFTEITSVTVSESQKSEKMFIVEHR